MDFNLLEKHINLSKLGKARIAELSGISRTTLDSAINGADIKISTLERIANVIGVNAGIFFSSNEIEGVTIDNGSASAVNVHDQINTPITSTNNSDEYAVLQERVKLLEQILYEKERLIKVLMER